MFRRVDDCFLDGIKVRVSIFLLSFFLKRLPPEVNFDCVDRFCCAAGIGFPRFPEEILANGRLASESDQIPCTHLHIHPLPHHGAPSFSPDDLTRSIIFDLSDH